MRFTRKILVGAICLAMAFVSGYAQEVKPVSLPAPQMDGGKPLMQVLKERKTSREFSSKELPLQVISNLLWAAFGVNRTDKGGRTAPSASNMQEIDIYIAKQDGLYLYDAKANALTPVLSEDIRSLTGKQPFVKDAPIDLVYVADLSKMKKLSVEDINFYSAADTGFIGENVYLYCVSEGLSTVIRGMADRPALAAKMGLKADQKIILTQTAGYPK